MPNRRDSCRFSLIALICFLALFGCIKVGPDFKQPSAKVSTTWQDVADRRVSTEPAQYRNWWQAFGDPTLDRLIETAYRENINLRIAGVRILEARAQLGVAIGAFFPQTQQAYGSVNKVRVSARAPQALFNTHLDYRTDELGGRASWELDFWGKYRRGIESAKATLDASVADYDNSLVSLTADVANNYINIRTLEKRLAIAAQNVETQKESLRIAQVKFKDGTATQRDVDQARTILADTQATIPTLEIQLRQTRNALSILLGLPPGDLGDRLGPASGDIPAPPLTVAVGIPADLLRRRPDIRAAEAQAAAQSAQIGVAKAELFPAFSLTGNFSFLASDVGKFYLADIFQWRARNATAGPSFTWNILNYGRIINNVRVQDARFQELLLGYQNTVLTAQREVEDQLVAFLRTQVRAKLLGESVQAAQDALGLAMKQYQGGVADFTTVLTAQQALLNEQDSLATTLGNISTSLVGIYRALGGGWEIREGQEFVPAEVKAEMAKRSNWGGLLKPVSQTPPPPAARPEAAKPPGS